jgi:cytochrome oxidase Cu insertion factor (SCO1/SenC/PrrC family)
VPPFSARQPERAALWVGTLAGEVWIADFIFTNLPGPCPLISTRMSELQKPLEKTDVHLVSFTVDPDTDTPEVLRGYAEKLHAEP